MTQAAGAPGHSKARLPGRDALTEATDESLPGPTAYHAEMASRRLLMTGGELSVFATNPWKED